MNNNNNRKDIPNFKRNDDGKRDNRDRRDLSSAIFFCDLLTMVIKNLVFKFFFKYK